MIAILTTCLAAAILALSGLCWLLWLVLPRPPGFDPMVAWRLTARRRAECAVWRLGR